jgi:hypothetical protein
MVISGALMAENNTTKTGSEKVLEVKKKSSSKMEKVISDAPPEPPAGYSRPVVKLKPGKKDKNNE